MAQRWFRSPLAGLSGRNSGGRWQALGRRLAELARPAWTRARRQGLEIARDRGSAERLPRGFFAFLLVFGVGMILISLVGDQGWIGYLRLQDEERALRTEIEALEARRHDLEQQALALRNDPGYIELIARKRLGLVKPGETVIYLKGAPPPPKEAP